MKRVLPPGFSRPVPIGKGGFGTVFRARQDDLGRWVALKQVPRGVKAREEAQAMAASPLPCLPTVHGVVQGRKADWISMEYVHGLSMREVLAIGLESAEAQTLAAALVGSVAVLHAAGRAHGDLKPDNLIVESNGNIRLVDLGFSGSGNLAVQGGTAGYCAPEAGGSSDGCRADLWSLGVVLHEVLVGVRPSPTEGAGGWKRLLRSAAEWIPLIDLLLREDPARRPKSAVVLLAELPETLPLSVAFRERVREQADRNLASRLVDEAALRLHDHQASEALVLLQQALELDPDQSAALGLLPRIHLDRRRFRWGWAVAAVALIAVGIAGFWAWPATSVSAVRAVLKADSGTGERLRRSQGGHSPVMPLREGAQ